MKKIIALLLCFVCLFSSLGLTSAAANVFNEVITNITINMGMEPDEPIIYGITYESKDMLSGISVMYTPSPTFTFTRPGTYTVTDDIPLSVDYEFVCWQDEDTGKLYYAGDKIYIDGTKVLKAVWQEKTDGKNRVIRTISTAIETFRRTLQAFFGFYKTKYEEDDVVPEADSNTFNLEGLISESHDYYADKRTYRIAVEPYGDDKDIYAAFSENYKIYFGGKFENVNVDVVKKDENGNVVKDSFGNTVYEKVVKKQLVGATQYSAFYRMTEDVYFTDKGQPYQIIEVTLTDGVPDPKAGEHITFVIPKGMLKHYIAENKYKTNETYAFAMLTTTTM